MRRLLSLPTSILMRTLTSTAVWVDALLCSQQEVDTLLGSEEERDKGSGVAPVRR